MVFQGNDDASDVAVVAGLIDETCLPQNGERIAQLSEPATQAAARGVTDSHVLDHLGRTQSALAQIGQRFVMAVQLNAIKIDGGAEQRRYTAPLSQQRQGLRKVDLVVKFDEANHITTTAAAIAVEQALLGIDQETGFVVGVQRTQSQPAATSQCPRWPPLLRLQIIQQRNLLL